MHDSSGRKHRVTLVHAPDIQYDQNYGTYFTPLWAYTLASHIPLSWSVTVFDEKIDNLEKVPEADVFAFSGLNQDIDSIRRVHRILRDQYPDATFIVGGPMTWSLQQEGKLDQLDGFDYIFILDGEESFPAFLLAFEEGDVGSFPRVIESRRFPLDQARPIAVELLRPRVDHYYGAVIEVSRGCPFLCEFCDIRVLPSNNRTHCKPVSLIIEDLDAHHNLGITQIQFACDNFIGDVVWARECVDAILEWKKRTGARLSIFTWLTINLYKMPELMKKMRKAGFSILFIGIESVNRHSLLETAKVQNIKPLEEAVQKIQSYGFIIAPGIIFGFDADTPRVFDETLDFLERYGLIGGDPSFLTALSGTPLYDRMKRMDRIADVHTEVTVRKKIETNIRYLQDHDFLKLGFIDFIRRYTSAELQLSRFQNHLRTILSSDNFVPLDGAGYGSPAEYLKMQWNDRLNRRMLIRRLRYVSGRFSRLRAVVHAWLEMKKASRELPNLQIHFNYWLYVWTNIALKYEGLTPDDFLLHSVGDEFDLNRLAEFPESRARGKGIGDEKVDVQARFTRRALRELVELKGAKSDSA